MELTSALPTELLAAAEPQSGAAPRLRVPRAAAGGDDAVGNAAPFELLLQLNLAVPALPPGQSVPPTGSGLPPTLSVCEGSDGGTKAAAKAAGPFSGFELPLSLTAASDASDSAPGAQQTPSPALASEPGFELPEGSASAAKLPEALQRMFTSLTASRPGADASAVSASAATKAPSEPISTLLSDQSAPASAPAPSVSAAVPADGGDTLASTAGTVSSATIAQVADGALKQQATGQARTRPGTSAVAQPVTVPVSVDDAAGRDDALAPAAFQASSPAADPSPQVSVSTVVLTQPSRDPVEVPKPDLALTATSSPAGHLPGHHVADAAASPTDAAMPAAPSSNVPLDTTAARWHEALASRLHWMLDHDIGEARIKLNPPALGALDVKISVHDDKTFVQLVASNAAARDELSQSLPRLRDLLSAGGLALGGATVSGGRDDSSAQHSAGQSAPQPYARPGDRLAGIAAPGGSAPARRGSIGSSQIDLYA